MSTIFNPVRRRFVQGLAAGGAASLCGAPVWAQSLNLLDAGDPQHLRGTEYDLRIGEQRVNCTGNERSATTINGSIPAPTLHWREGDTVTLRVTNTMAETTSIHWHGILLPANMDGVPGLSFIGIPPGETYTYQFKL